MGRSGSRVIVHVARPSAQSDRNRQVGEYSAMTESQQGALNIRIVRACRHTGSRSRRGSESDTVRPGSCRRLRGVVTIAHTPGTVRARRLERHPRPGRNTLDDIVAAVTCEVTAVGWKVNAQSKEKAGQFRVVRTASDGRRDRRSGRPDDRGPSVGRPASHPQRGAPAAAGTGCRRGTRLSRPPALWHPPDSPKSKGKTVGFWRRKRLRRWTGLAALLRLNSPYAAEHFACCAVPAFYLINMPPAVFLFSAPDHDCVDDPHHRVPFSPHIEVDIDGLWFLDDTAE